MARKKQGAITLAEECESREVAKRIGEVAKKNFAHLIPHRIDLNTVIFIKRNEDHQAQIRRYLDKLDRDRKNY